MKRLLLDLGNSRLKAAWQEGPAWQLLAVQNVSQIADLMPDSPDRIWLSSVAGTAQTRRVLAVLQRTESTRRVTLNQVSVPAYQHYLPTRYAAHQLGVDRWLAMLACYQYSPGPCLVVDCGTAVTLDLVNRQGEHIGGYILPGLRLMQQSVLQGTAIEGVEPDRPTGPVALDSASAITLGARHALAALIEKTLAEAAAGTRLMIGGGDAGELTPYLASSCIQLESMVLQGLACLADLEAE